MLVHPWAHFAAHSITECNSIQTTLCLSCTKVRDLFTKQCNEAGQVMMKSVAFHICSFHSSILQSGVTPPMQNALHSPLVLLNPKSMRHECGPPIGVRWAESGGRCYESLLKWPSFGCLSLHRPLSLALLMWPFLLTALLALGCLILVNVVDL